MADKATARDRRKYRSGSVFQRGIDGRWYGVIEAGYYSNGKRRRITVSTSAAEGSRACENKLIQKQREIIRNGTPAEGVGRNPTVRQWAATWLAIQERDKRPKSLINDRSNITAWVVPRIGQKRLDALTPADIRSIGDDIRSAGRAASTSRRVHVVLIKMLRDAVGEGHQVAQRVLMSKAPGAGESDRDAIELPHALALLKTAGELVRRNGEEVDASRWVAAFLQGMRPGECLGFTWPCLDLTKRTADISWQLQALPYKHGCQLTGARWSCGKKKPGWCPQREFAVPHNYIYRHLEHRWCLVRPKTEKGQRIIPLVPWMITAFEKWRVSCPPSPHGLVWPLADGGLRTSKIDASEWNNLQARANVKHASGRPYYLYEARHTTATLLLEAGVDTEIVKAIMGHSSVVTTRGYQHVSQTLTRKALEQLASTLQLNVPGTE